MTATKDHISPNRYVATKGPCKTIKQPYNTIKDHTRQCKDMKYHKRPYKTTIKADQCHARSYKVTDGRENTKQ